MSAKPLSCTIRSTSVGLQGEQVGERRAERLSRDRLCRRWPAAVCWAAVRCCSLTPRTSTLVSASSVRGARLPSASMPTRGRRRRSADAAVDAVQVDGVAGRDVAGAAVGVVDRHRDAVEAVGDRDVAERTGGELGRGDDVALRDVDGEDLVVEPAGDVSAPTGCVPAGPARSSSRPCSMTSEPSVFAGMSASATSTDTWAAPEEEPPLAPDPLSSSLRTRNTMAPPTMKNAIPNRMIRFERWRTEFLQMGPKARPTSPRPGPRARCRLAPMQAS